MGDPLTRAGGEREVWGGRGHGRRRVRGGCDGRPGSARDLLAVGGLIGLDDVDRVGLLEHAPALMAFCAPSTNSYRRLVPGYEAPVLLKHSQRNDSAAVRIPMYSPAPKAKRLEFRPPDPLANPYLTFPAMLMAGLDGIERALDPGEPIDRNLYELPPEQLAGIPTVPTSLDAALDALEADHEFLTQGAVFTDDLIATYIEFRTRVKIRPHPYEFRMYFDG
jgi:glutamine synthetase